jgi:hypothetical protein
VQKGRDEDMSNEKLDSQIGKSFDFYGASENQFKLGDVVWEAIEDECDGYRSCLGTVEVKESSAIFFKLTIAEVTLLIDSDGYFDGYQLVDTSDGHVWLRFGTDNTEDYYPCFTFQYSPKPSAEVKR